MMRHLYLITALAVFASLATGACGKKKKDPTLPHHTVSETPTGDRERPLEPVAVDPAEFLVGRYYLQGAEDTLLLIDEDLRLATTMQLPVRRVDGHGQISRVYATWEFADSLTYSEAGEFTVFGFVNVGGERRAATVRIAAPLSANQTSIDLALSFVVLAGETVEALVGNGANQSGANQSGANQSGPNQSGANQSGGAYQSSCNSQYNDCDSDNLEGMQQFAFRFIKLNR